MKTGYMKCKHLSKKELKVKIRNKCIHNIFSYIKKSWEKAIRINKKIRS